jgi:hypothetical protein
MTFLFWLRRPRFAALVGLLVAGLPACGSTTAPPASSQVAAAAPSGHHHHKLDLPPVGPSIVVAFGGRDAEVALATVAHGESVALLDVWKAALPDQEPASLRFDVFGSDGFHPAARPDCGRLLTGSELARARLDVKSHDLTFDGVELPHCYRVHAVVRIEAIRDDAADVGKRAPVLIATAARCAAADWTPRTLRPLLEAGKRQTASQRDRAASRQLLFDADCTDAPDGPRGAPSSPVVVDGVELRVASAMAAGASGRGWTGNRCAFDVRLADGSGPVTHLGEKEIPPFTTVNAVVRAGSAAWLSVSYNGYTREFPNGGNRVIAVDLCEGRVVWQSKDSTSNGGLLLLDDYLVSPYGFTSEPRFVFVLDARSGAVVQKLPVVENICPSKSWAPNWHQGERCDAPGQRVGAATEPRVEGGLLLVDTNTGSASFQFK